MAPSADQELERRLEASGVAAEALGWLRQIKRAIEGARITPSAIDAAFVACGRKLGSQPLAKGPAVAGPDDSVPLDHFSRSAAGRAVLLMAQAKVPSFTDDLPRRLLQLFREGDSSEKTAMVQSLPLLEGGPRFLAIAHDAARTNQLDLFTQLACHNPYPARHYSDAEWNQLVLKAAFVGAPIAEMLGLADRRNADLDRMVSDFADERRAAGRPVPQALFLALTASASNASRRDAE